MAKANYDLPNDVINRVRKLSNASSKREAIIVALESFLQQRRLEELIASYGKVSLQWTKKSLANFRR
jgi:hypothetical protein